LLRRTISPEVSVTDDDPDAGLGRITARDIRCEFDRARDPRNLFARDSPILHDLLE